MPACGPNDARVALHRAHAAAHSATVTSSSIIALSVAMPAVRQNRSKLAVTFSHASSNAQSQTIQPICYLSSWRCSSLCNYTPSLQAQGGQRRLSWSWHSSATGYLSLWE